MPPAPRTPTIRYGPTHVPKVSAMFSAASGAYYLIRPPPIWTVCAAESVTVRRGDAHAQWPDRAHGCDRAGNAVGAGTHRVVRHGAAPAAQRRAQTADEI